MSENILSVLTTKNYWDVVNDYKPLMHLWYVGIIFQFYIVIPVILYLGKVVSKVIRTDQCETMKWTLFAFTILSLVVYFAPEYMRGSRFYMLPSRFFEMGMVGFVAISIKDTVAVRKSLKLFATLGLAFLFMLGGVYSKLDCTNEYIKEALLLSTVILSVFVVLSKCDSKILSNKLLGTIGKMSYSIFIWHQIVIAMYRYTITTHFGLFDFAILIILISVISILSYYLIEKKISISHKTFAASIALTAVCCIPSFYIYSKGGVLYDIPELDAYKENAHRGMFGEYCDRVYKMDVPFDDTERIKVLVVGNSFARDFTNTILESKMKDSLNVTYAYNWDAKNIADRIKQSDYIFVHSLKSEIPDSILKMISTTTTLKGIGTKNFGECNGQVFCRRNSNDYFELTIPMEAGTQEKNMRMKDEWQDNYVDFIEIARTEGENVRVFTPDHRFISQDCRHLTQAGAQWYATQFDWAEIFSWNK